MDSAGDHKIHRNRFFLEKWFLDFVTEEGEVFIFYAAKLRWHHITVPYKSMLSLSSTTGKKHKARYYHVLFPEMRDKNISWKDSSFKMTGSWLANTIPVQAKLFESAEGGLQWNCLQPSSFVKAKINKREYDGLGYAEQLILTVEPWKIPMDVLRWGRFVAKEDCLVWIEIKSGADKQWVWYNGEKMDQAVISDELIELPSKNIRLVLNNIRLIEAEKKMNNVIKKLLRFMPGFHRSVPANFLLADEYKWISRGSLYKEGLLENEGWVIHERVDFKK